MDGRQGGDNGKRRMAVVKFFCRRQLCFIRTCHSILWVGGRILARRTVELSLYTFLAASSSSSAKSTADLRQREGAQQGREIPHTCTVYGGRTLNLWLRKGQAPCQNTHHRRHKQSPPSPNQKLWIINGTSSFFFVSKRVEPSLARCNIPAVLVLGMRVGTVGQKHPQRRQGVPETRDGHCVPALRGPCACGERKGA